MQNSAPHIFQSSLWAEFQKQLDKVVHHASGDDWEYFAILESAEGSKGLVKRLYAPYGPVCSSEQGLLNALSSLESYAEANKATYLRVEPIDVGCVDTLTKNSYKKSAKSFQPEQTFIADISDSCEGILSRMKGNNRRSWNTYSNTDLVEVHSFETVTAPDEINDFLLMMRATEKRTGAVLRGNEYLETLYSTFGPVGRGGIAYVTSGGIRLGGALFVDSADTRYYMYAGTFDEAREVHANTTLVTYLMLDAHKKGLKFFDFFGVCPPDADKSHPWFGLSMFKRSFGGVDVIYGGTYEKPLRKISYKILQIAKKQKK
jgi:lipid II:glycine glycyltransferase (peptidoglycan interpeptide bridge formation enzyme)